MSKEKTSSAVPASEATQPTTDENTHHPAAEVQRRSFLKGLGVAGAAMSAGALLGTKVAAEESSGSLTKGDAAILRFLAAAEIIESDLWLQYQELGGVQDDEVSKLASKLIPGYPAQPTGGNPVYTEDLLPLDGDMSQYIHDNTEDELTHEVFINSYLKSKSADTVNLDRFRERKDLTPEQSVYAQPTERVSEWPRTSNGQIGLADLIGNIGATTLIGLSTVGGAFTEAIVREMARKTQRPIIFSLSNPTDKSEAKPEDLIRWTAGRALVPLVRPLHPSAMAVEAFPLHSATMSSFSQPWALELWRLVHGV